MGCNQTEEERFHARRLVVEPSLCVVQAPSGQTPGEALNVGLVRVVRMVGWGCWVRDREGGAGYDLGSWPLCCVSRRWVGSPGTVEGLLANVGRFGVIWLADRQTPVPLARVPLQLLLGARCCIWG